MSPLEAAKEFYTIPVLAKELYPDWQEPRRATKSLWLKSFGGEQVLIARKKDGLVLLEDPCLTVVFLVTPSKLSELFAIPRLCEAGLLPRFCVVNPHCLPSKIPLDAGAEAKILPSDASQPYEAAIFACFERYRLELNDEPMVIDTEPEARNLMIHYFNALVDVPNHGPFEARIAEQAIKFALIYHVFSRIEIEQRSAGTYGVKELDEELPPLGRLAIEAGLGISEWFAKGQDEYLAKKREEDKENVYYRFYQRVSKFPHFTTRELYSAGLGVQTAAAARKYFREWEDRGLLEQIKSEQSGACRADGNFLGIGSLRLSGDGSHEPERDPEAERDKASGAKSIGVWRFVSEQPAPGEV